MATDSITLVATMVESGKPFRLYQVGQDSNGNLFTREKRARMTKWRAVQMQFNPTLDVYLARCESNFGYRTERL